MLAISLIKVTDLIDQFHAALRSGQFHIESQSVDQLTINIHGSGDRNVSGLATLAEAQAEHLSFVSNAKYREQAAKSSSKILVANSDFIAQLEFTNEDDRTYLVCKNPYAVFALLLQLVTSLQKTIPAGISPGAVIDPSAKIGADVSIAAGVNIAANTVIGDAAILHPGVVVREGASIGARSELRAHVVIETQCVVGDDCLIHANTVIGADGFGFAPVGKQWIKIPQVGCVRIGNRVEVGASTTIDRGALDDTVIGDDVKIDNLVQIAHNCQIGDRTMIAACTGIAGSAVVGKDCQIGGAAMILGHITIADGSIISNSTFVSRSIKTPGFFTGVFPMMTHEDWERNAANLRRLDDLRNRVKRIEKQLVK